MIASASGLPGATEPPAQLQVRRLRMDRSEMISRVGGGLLSFPVTHFDASGAFDEQAYREHCAWLLEHQVAGLFAAGGTGEFFSLRPEEVEQVVAAAVAETAGRVPVVAG